MNAGIYQNTSMENKGETYGDRERVPPRIVSGLVLPSYGLRSKNFTSMKKNREIYRNRKRVPPICYHHKESLPNYSPTYRTR